MTKGSKFDDFLKDENIEIDEEKIKENIEQMTDKEIIIDGVDVSECEFYTTMEDCVGIHDLCEQLDDYCSIKKDCYYKQLKQLEQENAELKAYMDVNEDFKTAWAELKAENDRLKRELSGKRFICPQCMEFAKEIHKYKQTLQEIKAIAEKRNYLDYGEALDDILDLITKAESEG